MEQLIGLVAKAVLLYMSTDLDDIFVLIVFFSDSRFRTHEVVTGQFVGIAALYGLSVGCSLISFVVPQAYIGLLGLAPIVIGIKKSWYLLKYFDRTSEDEDLQTIIGTRANVVTVAVVTVANGGDNMSVYIPLFASRSGFDVIIIGVTFAIMTVVWLGLAHSLTHHRTVGAMIHRYERLVLPVALVALGAFILYESGTTRLFRI